MRSRRCGLPGGGGAPEIASNCRQIYIVMAQTRRSFVERVDFITSFGHGEGGDHRQRLGIRTAGPTLVVTDLCLMQPDPDTKELTVVSLHPGVTREQVQANTGWPLRFAATVVEDPTAGRTRARRCCAIYRRAPRGPTAARLRRMSEPRDEPVHHAGDGGALRTRSACAADAALRGSAGPCAGTAPGSSHGWRPTPSRMPAGSSASTSRRCIARRQSRHAGHSAGAGAEREQVTGDGARLSSTGGNQPGRDR